MIRTNLLTVCTLIPFMAQAAAQPVAQDVTSDVPAYIRAMAKSPTRAIRRDVPMTRAIRQAFEAGTRDLTGRPGPKYWQLETDFTIEARLDRKTQTIFGKEEIVVHNNSTKKLRQLVLRLDHNLFRARVPRGSSVPAETTEGMVVTRLVVDGQEISVKPGGRRRGGSGVSGLDKTVAIVRLAKSIAPQQKAVVQIEWHTKLPGGNSGRGHRMTQRWDDTLFQPTQWFPRLAKYDDLRGWDTNPYLGPAEFYNNFGRFDVRIDVPAGWIVSATGVLQNPKEVLTAAARERLSHVLESDDELTIVGEDELGPGKSTASGDRLVWHYVADKVNDFVWATAENFVWKATRATIPEKGPVPIHMVFLPERARRFRNAGKIARHALEFYSKLWAPYPFPQLTMQDGPSAGMEYPMVVNSNQGAADHEVAHQWWPMMLGTNETWYAWMDEGFNMYMNSLSSADSRGREPNFDGRGRSYGRLSGNESEPSMMWSSNYAGDQYGFQAYMKAPLMLSMLGGIVGDEAVQKAMSAYTKAWAFKHPSPWDFVFFMSNELEKDLGWFWYYWLWTTESVDGAIESVRGSGSETVVTIRQDGQMPSPVVLLVSFADEGAAIEPMANAKPGEENTMLVTWPVDVWFGGSRRFEAKLKFGSRKIEKIILDPAGRFPDKTPKDSVWINK